MDRSRLVAVATGILAVGLAASPAAAAGSADETPSNSTYNATSAFKGTLAEDTLGTNDFPCCV
ncbi:hypothetical protein ACWGQ4_21490 [Streptomyces sp. NPDC055721]|uniref:hypothetical protein n=1 Tax=Streptomyces sp. NPDC127132 TaxID=3345374 RepID=UPI00363EE26C